MYSSPVLAGITSPPLTRFSPHALGEWPSTSVMGKLATMDTTGFCATQLSHAPSCTAIMLHFGLRMGLLSLQGFQDGAWRHGQPVHADANRLIDGVGQGR